ncbi:WYL domain-containing protein [Vibrio vulnificus]|uniref:WYL domain-containing protein n=1 Tax=Vibrio vulnificus TaxID=672 RepID=UPI001F04F8E0|nr:WYL domain-containing protein [Vibrio vulnificus]MCG9655164.1 transcriptional regulator [Vibrio vulnificus]
MPKNTMNTINSLSECDNVGSHAKAERLAFIDFKVRYEGAINRGDIAREFGVSDTIASKDISLYKEITNGQNLLPTRTNTINVEGYSPLIDIKAHNALDMIFEGFCRNKLNDVHPSNYKRACYTADLPQENVSIITRAIHRKKRVLCSYVSANSDKRKLRKLEPVGAYYDGLNWIFRALDLSDENKTIYKSFHFSRVIEVVETTENALASVESDAKWNSIIPMQLQLHPTLSEIQKEGYRKDFGMEEGQNEMLLTPTLVESWSIIERWGIDTNITPLPIRRFPFHLKNAEMLQTIDGFNFIVTDLRLAEE